MTPIAPERMPVQGAPVTYAKNQPEYKPLPVWKTDTTVISVWRLSWIERIRALLGKPLYVEVMNFDRPLQPIFLTFDEQDLAS